jgi:hypothetical protein
MEFNTDLNYIGIIAATIVAFVIGGAWYSPILFARPWMRENGFTEDDHRGNLLRMFGGSAVMLLIAAYVLSLVIGDDSSLLEGLRIGLAVGAAFVAASFAVTYLFEKKSPTLFVINAGYHVVTFTVMGAIIGATSTL